MTEEEFRTQFGFEPRKDDSHSGFEVQIEIVAESVPRDLRWKTVALCNTFSDAVDAHNAEALKMMNTGTTYAIRTVAIMRHSLRFAP